MNIPATHTSGTDQVSIELYDGDRYLGSASVTNGAWCFTTTVPLEPGSHSFFAKAGSTTSGGWDINVLEADGGLDLPRPHVTEAASEGGDKERLDYYKVRNDIHVVIPDYGMRTGDTVKVYWFGRTITLGSEIQLVGSPPKLKPFVISQYEVIDVIRSNASIKYTVRRPPGEVDHQSATLELIVDGHTYEINAPSLRGNNLRVLKESPFDDQSTAAVRCIAGKDDADIWSSESRDFGRPGYLDFTIDPSWHSRNKGKPVKFNRSGRIKTSNGTNYLFSRLLRIDVLE